MLAPQEMSNSERFQRPLWSAAACRRFPKREPAPAVHNHRPAPTVIARSFRPSAQAWADGPPGRTSPFAEASTFAKASADGTGDKSAEWAGGPPLRENPGGNGNVKMGRDGIICLAGRTDLSSSDRAIIPSVPILPNQFPFRLTANGGNARIKTSPPGGLQGGAKPSGTPRLAEEH